MICHVTFDLYLILSVIYLVISAVYPIMFAMMLFNLFDQCLRFLPKTWEVFIFIYTTDNYILKLYQWTLRSLYWEK